VFQLMVPFKSMRRLQPCPSHEPSLYIRSIFAALVACGLVLVVVQQSEAFTMASMPGVSAGPAVLRSSRQQCVTMSDRRPIETACSHGGNTWSGIMCASLLLVGVGVPQVSQSRALRTPRRRSVGCQGMGSFKVCLPHTTEHGFNSLQGFHLIAPSSSVMPQHAVPSAATVVLVPAVRENEFTLTIGCTRPAGRLIGGHRRPVRPRRQQSHAQSQSTRRQTGARLLSVQSPPVQPLPYDPSRVRMKIQDVLRFSTSCVSIAIGREAKTVAAKSEFSHCASLYISGNGSHSEDH